MDELNELEAEAFTCELGAMAMPNYSQNQIMARACEEEDDEEH